MAIARIRVFELALAVVIGLALVAAVILYAEIGPFRWMPSIRWWGLAGITAILIGYTARDYRRHWRRRSFWLHMAWLTAAHLAVWSIVLANVSVWGLLWFVPPLFVEAGLLVLILHKLGYD